MSAPKEHRYTQDSLTVIWKPSVCIHATNCWKELPEVFQPKARPWIKTDGATIPKIKAQIGRCPSGALSFADANDDATPEGAVVVTVTPDGPLLISGNIALKNGDEQSQLAKTALCRCGSSANKPFCDGSHKASGFKG